MSTNAELELMSQLLKDIEYQLNSMASLLHCFETVHARIRYRLQIIEEAEKVKKDQEPV